MTYKFTGKERDPESNLDNFGARYFTSNLGRFTSPDPANAGRIFGDPQSWNAYSYARNNLLKFQDPFGAKGYTLAPDNQVQILNSCTIAGGNGLKESGIWTLTPWIHWTSRLELVVMLQTWVLTTIHLSKQSSS